MRETEFFAKIVTEGLRQRLARLQNLQATANQADDVPPELDRKMQREPGNAAEVSWHSERGTVDHINNSTADSRPTGNTAKTGTRRLRKAP